VLLEWTPSTHAFSRYVEIETRKSGDTVWMRHPDALDEEGFAYLLGLQPGIGYEIRARRRNTIGAVGDWSSILNYTPLAVNAVDNMLRNSNFEQDVGYPVGASYPDTRSLRFWGPGYSNTAIFGRNYQGGTVWNPGLGGCWFYMPQNIVGNYAYVWQRRPIQANLEYEASAYVTLHRGLAYLYMLFLDAGLNTVGTVVDTLNSGTATLGDPYDLSKRPRLWCKGTAPATATQVQYMVVLETTAQSSPYPFITVDRCMLCVAPSGVTRSTATPWVPGSADTTDGQMINHGSLVVADFTSVEPITGVTTVAQFNFTPYGNGVVMVNLSANAVSRVYESFNNLGGKGRYWVRITQNGVTIAESPKTSLANYNVLFTVEQGNIRFYRSEQALTLRGAVVDAVQVECRLMCDDDPSEGGTNPNITFTSTRLDVTMDRKY
jgi:hypothetical protein